MARPGRHHGGGRVNLFGDALRDALDPLTNPALREAA